MPSSRSSRFSRLMPFRLSRSRQSSTGPRSSPPSEPQAELASTAPVFDPCPQGLEIVAEADDPVIDIVAVHGLNGHRDKTWTASNGVHWLRDLLPQDIPRTRVFSWGYDANTHASSRVSCQYLYDHARTLISDLCRKRSLSNSAERPIIFVAHSLGGIVLKSALIHSDAARRGALEEHHSIKVSTYGIVFMGTPHQGGNGVQLGRLLVNVASLFVAADDRMLKHLERDSEWLQQQLGQYGPIGGDFVTKFAFEEYETPTAFGHSIMVVPRASAVVPGQADAEPIAIHADHTNMTRYASRGDGGYNTISEHLQIMARAAPEVIRLRWEAERRAGEARVDASGAAFAIGFSLSEVFEVTHFVARTEELARIHKVLGEGTGRRTVVVHGLGGMGKTQLAREYARRHRDDYSAVFWLNAKDETSLKQGYAKVAGRILREHPSVVYVRNAVENRDLSETVQAVKRWLDSPKNDRWLAIYDNYDNAMLDGDGEITPGGGRGSGEEPQEDANDASQDYDIRPFLPDAYQGAILVTTRSSRVNIGHRIALGKLKDEGDSLEIILAHTSRRQDLRGDADAVKLARKLDGLPLALSTAGAYLDNVATPVAEYLQMYEESWLRLQKSTPRLLSYKDHALYSTWDISYAQVEQKNMTSSMLLRLWAYFDNDDLWFELLRAGRRSNSPQWFRDLAEDTVSFNEAMRVLCDYGLVEADTSSRERRGESRGYGIHSCVHSWTIHVLNKSLNVDIAQLAMKCVASHVPEDTEQEYWVVQGRLMQHASHCLATLERNGMQTSTGDEPALHRLGRLFFIQGRLGDAEAMYKRALKGEERTLGPEHISTLNTVNSLGNLYDTQGRLSDAEALYKRALKGKEKAVGPEHASTLDTVHNLGVLYKDYGRLGDAEAMYKRALKGKEKALGPEHASTLDTVNDLGALYKDQGQLSDAEAMYKRALQGYKKALGLEHTSTLSAVNNLGTLYGTQGQFSDAEAMYEQALQGYEKAFGPEHTSTLSIVNNLGNVYSTQGQLSDAEAMYKRALQGYEKVLGHEQVDGYIPALYTICNLALVIAELDRVSEARVWYVRCQAGFKNVFGVQDRLYQKATRELASLGQG